MLSIGDISPFCTTQEKKAELRAKEEEEHRLKEKASISVPLVAEDAEDVKRAQGVEFVSGSSEGERKRRRRDICSQSVFGKEGTEGVKRVRLALATSSSSSRQSQSRSEPFSLTSKSKSVSKLRSSLGVRTSDRKSC